MILPGTKFVQGSLAGTASRSLTPVPALRPPHFSKSTRKYVSKHLRRVPGVCLPSQRSVLTRFKADEQPEEATPREVPAPAKTAPVLFTLAQHCAYGQNWRVCGNSPELGNWDPNKALHMQWSPGDQWFALAELPESKHVEYKHVLYDEDTGVAFWVQEGPGSNLSIEVVPETRTISGPSAAVVGGSPGAPDVKQMEKELQEERAAGLAMVEVERISHEAPTHEALPYGHTVMEEFTEASLEAQDIGPRGPVGPMISPEQQTDHEYKPPTDVPASVAAVPPGAGGVPPSHGHEQASFHDQVAAAAEAAGATEAAREAGVVPEEPTVDELAGAAAAAAAEPSPSEQLEQAHAAGSVPLSSTTMMSDTVVMDPRNAGHAAAQLMGHDQGPHPPHGFVPKSELIDPGKEAAELLKLRMRHEVEVAASAVQQMVRHAGRAVSKAAQSLHLPAGMVADEAKGASQQVADAALEEADRFGGTFDGDVNGYASEEEAIQAEIQGAEASSAIAEQGGATAAEVTIGGSQGMSHFTAETHEAARSPLEAGKQVAREAKEVEREAEKGIKELTKVAAEAVEQAISEASESLDVDVAGDPTSNAVAEQLAEEQDTSKLLDGQPLTLSESIAAAAENFKGMPPKLASSVSKALRPQFEQAKPVEAGQVEAEEAKGMQAEQSGYPKRGSAPGGLKNSWDYTVSQPLVNPAVASAPGTAAASLLPPRSNPTAMAGLKQGDEPEASRSSQIPGEAPPENVLHWAPDNTPKEKGKIADLPVDLEVTPGGVGGQLGTETTSAEQDSWTPKTGQGVYKPPHSQTFPASESNMTDESGGGLTQHMDSSVSSPPPSPPPDSPPRSGPNTIMAAGVEGPHDQQDDFAGDDSARLCSMRGEAMQRELSKEFTQPRTPENAEGRYKSVADVVQSSAIVPKPGQAAADEATKSEAEALPRESDQPLFSPRLAYMSREDREVLEQKARQQASQRIPEEYEAAAESGLGGQDVTQEARGDMLEEPRDLLRSPVPPGTGEEVGVEDIE